MSSAAGTSGAIARTRSGLVLAGCLVVVGLCWLMLTPPGAGADEPAHLTRAAAVIRGQFHGPPDPNATDPNVGEIYSVPQSAQMPEPACYAFHKTVPVGCATPVGHSSVTVQLVSTSDDYPPAGHLVYGVGTLLPGMSSVWPARLLGAACAFGLIGTAIATARSAWARAAILTAISPMAWGTLATVNPSTYAIGGGVALWVVLWRSRRTGRLIDDWLFALGWAALVLTRRDGILWAPLIVAISMLATDRSALEWLANRRRWPLAVIGATTLVQIVWGLASGSRISQLGSLAPLLIPLADLIRSLWHRYVRGAAGSAIAAATLTGAAVLALMFAARFRPGGWDGLLARDIAAHGGDHLVQAIGVLGWLDTALPSVVIGAFIATLGIMFGVALTERPAIALTAAVVLIVAVVSAWWLELMSGAVGGQYWQGRYSLPILVGVPIVLGALPLSDHLARRLGLTVSVLSLTCVNAAAWAAARRWGVGTDGGYLPWDWHSTLQPVAPVVLLAVMAVASALAVAAIAATPNASPPRH